MSLAVIDIVYIVIILLFGFAGLKRGFFSQIVTVAGVVGGIFLAYFFSDDLAVSVEKLAGINEFNDFIAFILILLVAILVAMLINKIMHTTLKNMGADGTDRILGLSFGFIQGLFASIILTALLAIQPLIDPGKIFDDSIIGSRLLKVLPHLQEIIPIEYDRADIEKIGKDI